MNAPEEIGKVTEKWWQTKKILEWKYQTPLPIAGPLLAKLGIPVASISIHNGRGDGPTTFVAESSWFSGRHNGGELSDLTLEGLKVKVEAAFRDRLVAHSDVKWEEWVELEVRGREVSWLPDGDVKENDRRGSASITIEYKILKRARFPDGRDMVLDGSALYPFPKAKAVGVDIERGRHHYNIYSQETDHQFAYIRATPENLEALKILMKKMEEVNDRLLAVLDQKSIGKTVGQLTSGVLMLDKPRG